MPVSKYESSNSRLVKNEPELKEEVDTRETSSVVVSPKESSSSRLVKNEPELIHEVKISLLYAIGMQIKKALIKYLISA
jgi:hypothetical protein